MNLERGTVDPVTILSGCIDVKLEKPKLIYSREADRQLPGLGSRVVREEMRGPRKLWGAMDMLIFLIVKTFS